MNQVCVEASLGFDNYTDLFRSSLFALSKHPLSSNPSSFQDRFKFCNFKSTMILEITVVILEKLLFWMEKLRQEQCCIQRIICSVKNFK